MEQSLRQTPSRSTHEFSFFTRSDSPCSHVLPPFSLLSLTRRLSHSFSRAHVLYLTILLTHLFTHLLPSPPLSLSHTHTHTITLKSLSHPPTPHPYQSLPFISVTRCPPHSRSLPHMLLLCLSPTPPSHSFSHSLVSFSHTQPHPLFLPLIRLSPSHSLSLTRIVSLSHHPSLSLVVSLCISSSLSLSLVLSLPH